MDDIETGTHRKYTAVDAEDAGSTSVAPTATGVKNQPEWRVLLRVPRGTNSHCDLHRHQKQRLVDGYNRVERLGPCSRAAHDDVVP
jgi:hypothetical protein